METATETRFGEILSRAQETGRAVGAPPGSTRGSARPSLIARQR